LPDPGVAAGDDGFLALELAGWLVEFRAAFPVRDVFDGGLGVELAFLLAGGCLLLDWGQPACVVGSAGWFMMVLERGVLPDSNIDLSEDILWGTRFMCESTLSGEEVGV